MRRDVLELRSGNDVLVLARFGTLDSLPMATGRRSSSSAAVERFLNIHSNLDRLRRRWGMLHPAPPMAWYSDAELRRMVRTAVDRGRVDAVVISTLTSSRGEVDTRPFVQDARKFVAAREAAAAQERLAAHPPSQSSISRPPQPRPVVVPVTKWPLEQRVEEVARRAGSKVPGEAGSALKELVSPEAIGLMVGLIAVGALAQLTPFGWVADAAIVGIAFLFGGLAAVHALGDIIECFDLTKNAKSEADLELASEALSRAIVGIGLVAVIALLHRFAKGGKKGAATDVAEPKPAPRAEMQQSAQRRARPVEQNSRPPPEKPKTTPPEKKAPAEKASVNPTNEQVAKELLAKAAEAEKSTTPSLQKLAQDTGSKMEGLENRLKTPESLARKLNDTPPAQIADALRYTMVSEEAALAGNAAKTLATLEQQGYKVLKVKDTFKGGAPYKGVNTQVQAPNGQVFELQFHTPESFAMKQSTHGLYEEMRVLPPTSERAQTIQQELVKMNESLPNPPGLPDSLGRFKK